MGKTYTVEKIVGHRIKSNGKMEFYVKWKGFDSTENTWEPEASFLSRELVDNYLSRVTQVKKEPNVSPETVKRNYLKESDLIKEEEIQANNYIPKKVLNIFHLKNDEKKLVALIEFTNRKNNGFVRAEWANKNCPQLVIEFYEARIFWKNRMTGEVVKYEIVNNIEDYDDGSE